MHLYISWQLLGRFITDSIQVWIVTDAPTTYPSYAPIVSSVSDTFTVFTAAFKSLEHNYNEATFLLLPFLNSLNIKRRYLKKKKAVGIKYSWHFPCDKQLILKFVFPYYSLVATIFLTWFQLRLASAQPLCPFILSVIHPYQCALVNGKSGFASAQNAPILEPGLYARSPNPVINMTLVYAPFSVDFFCTHGSSEGEAADNEKLHKHNTAGNKGKVLQLVDKNLFFWSFDWGIFICSVFNISQLFEK